VPWLLRSESDAGSVIPHLAGWSWWELCSPFGEVSAPHEVHDMYEIRTEKGWQAKDVVGESGWEGNTRTWPPRNSISEKVPRHCSETTAVAGVSCDMQPTYMHSFLEKERVILSSPACSGREDP
jgi:hypothetical protein